MPTLEVSDLRLTYASNGRGIVRVLNGVSFEVAQGEFLAVLGPSGCGKSSLLRIIAGLEKRYSGIVSSPFDGPANERPAMSMNFQKPVLLPWLSVEENAYLPFDASSTPISAKHRRRFEELVALVGLKGFRQALPSELSGGMQMRAALVRSFITEPKLMLMDEPFASLDEVTRTRLGIELRTLAKQTRATVIFVTHSIQEAVHLADRVVLLSARPAKLISEYPIDLPPIRDDDTLASPQFAGLAAQLRKRISHE